MNPPKVFPHPQNNLKNFLWRYTSDDIQLTAFRPFSPQIKTMLLSSIPLLHGSLEIIVTTFSQPRIRACDQTHLYIPTGLLDYKLIMSTAFFSLKKSIMFHHSRHSGYYIRLVSGGSSPGSCNLHMTLNWSLNISGFIFFNCKMRGIQYMVSEVSFCGGRLSYRS